MTFKTSLAAGVLAALMLPATAFADAALDDIYARATPPNARNGAAYATISSVDGDRLIAVATEAAGVVQIHDTSMEDGVAKMREIEGGLEIPAGGSVTLQPGGKHIMLMGLTGPLVEGEELKLILTFEKAGEVKATAPIRKLGGHRHGADHGAEHGHGEMQHGH